MNELVVYALKVNIAIALFYLFYRLFFAGDTFWKTRRFYLLFSVVLSFVYPFFSVQQWLQQQEPVQQLIISAVMLPEYVVQPVGTPTTNYFSFENVIIGIYALVVIVLTSRMMMQVLSIGRFRLLGEPEIIQDVRVINIKKEITPFSFFGNIYINASLHSAKELEQILAHELTHVRQLHSFDVLISEMLCNVFWFNPATWLLKREIRQNLEFLADNKVLESGFDSKTYQYHLLQLAYQNPELKITNKFNVSPLKKRITMMNLKKTNKAKLLKYSLIVPLALTLVVSSNAQEIVEKAKYTIDSKSTEVSNAIQNLVMPVESAQVTVDATATKTKDVWNETTETTSATDSIKNKQKATSKEGAFITVEEMPEYPGGVEALIQFISKNLKYPKASVEKGVEGVVITRFVITKAGVVEKAQIVRGLDSLTNAEALRVVSIMPKWVPGKQKGETVDVEYTLPIRFKLGEKPIIKESKTTSTIVKFNNADGSVSEAYTVAEKMPEFPGGANELMKYIAKNIKYPVEAQRNGIQGTVIIRFVVSKLGNIEQVGVVKTNTDNRLQGVVVAAYSRDTTKTSSQSSKSTTALEQEAMRVVKTMPNWTPGENNGEKVAVFYSLPIKFKLN